LIVLKGYLDKELSDHWNLHVLGLERDAYRVLAASQRTNGDTKENTANRCRSTFKELAVKAEDSLEDQIESVVVDWFDELKTEHESAPLLCMIGLHSCGDLSPVMMKLFMSSQRFCTLLLVSCCYHRMDWKKDVADENLFPLSSSLKNACRTPFHQQEGIQHLFRLAAQETPNHWMQQNVVNCQRQAQHTFYRSIIQLYAAKGSLLKIIAKHNTKSIL
jgi:hypothetical protein